MKAIVVILIILVIIIALPFIILKYSGKEYFTEIYFNDPENLPKIMETGGKYDVYFTIISHEKESTTYFYRVDSEIIFEETEIRLSEGIELLPGENKTIALIFTPEDIGEGNVTVSLMNGGKERDIYFFYYIFE